MSGKVQGKFVTLVVRAFRREDISVSNSGSSGLYPRAPMTRYVSAGLISKNSRVLEVHF